jgi:hypothetical protein
MEKMLVGQYVCASACVICMHVKDELLVAMITGFPDAPGRMPKNTPEDSIFLLSAALTEFPFIISTNLVP